MGNARETRRGNEVILGQIENEEPPALPPRPQMENVISEHENRANGTHSRSLSISNHLRYTANEDSKNQLYSNEIMNV